MWNWAIVAIFAFAHPHDYHEKPYGQKEAYGREDNESQDAQR